MPEKRKPSCVLLTAWPGDLRAARGLVSQVLREALGFRALNTAPNWVHYQRAEGDITPRYTLEATEQEWALISERIGARSKRDGWDRPPVDMYRD